MGLSVNTLRGSCQNSRSIKFYKCPVSAVLRIDCMRKWLYLTASWTFARLWAPLTALTLHLQDIMCKIERVERVRGKYFLIFSSFICVAISFRIWIASFGFYVHFFTCTIRSTEFRCRLWYKFSSDIKRLVLLMESFVVVTAFIGLLFKWGVKTPYQQTNTTVFKLILHRETGGSGGVLFSAKRNEWGRSQIRVTILFCLLQISWRL